MRVSRQNIFFYRILLLIAVILDLSPVIAQQNNPHFEHVSVKNGLSSNRVQNIIQDRQGFYWIATVDGLNRFDGSNFKIFQHDRNDSSSISNNSCNIVLEGKDGDIWVATQQGVSRFQKKKGSFKNYFFHHPDFNDNILNAIYGLTIDKEGNIWATSNGLWRINPSNDSVSGYLYNRNDTSSVSDASNLFNVSFDSVNNGLWMNTDLSLNFFDIKKGEFFHHRHNPLQWSVFRLNNSKPFFANAGDYFWAYDKESELLYRFKSDLSLFSSVHLVFPHSISNFSVNAEGHPLFSFELVPAVSFNWQQKRIENLPEPDINSGINFSGITHYIYNDIFHNKWVCTREGVYIIRHGTNLLRSFYLGSNNSGFPNTIYSFVKQKNSLWLQIRNGLFQYDIARQKLIHIPGYDGKITKILRNAGDTMLWISEKNKIVLIDFRTLHVDTKIFLEGNPYFAIKDNQDHTWVGTWDKGLYEFDENGRIMNHFIDREGLKYNYLICGWYDRSNDLWIGLNGDRGFVKLDLKTRKFESGFITGNKRTAEFNTITAIIKDKSGNLWLGTYGGGLYNYDNRRKEFHNYQRSDGLSGDHINSLVFDDIGNLWISTVNGIDIMDLPTKSFRHVNEPMQQVNNDHIDNLTIGEDGTLFYSADNKILAINPRQYISAAEEAKILLSGFKIFDKEEHSIDLSLPVNLSFRQNFFTLEFSAIKAGPEIPAKYKYKLEGFNEEWIYSGNRGFANFTNVPPGNYTLLLNATNVTGKWNDKPVEVRINIKPPFWKTWWFYVLSVILAGSIIVFVVISRVGQFKNRQQEQLRLIVATQEKEKKSIASELHDDLGVRLSALKYFITSLKKYLSPDNAQSQAIFDKTISTIDDSVEDVRYLLINLSPKTLNEYGYLVAVEDLVNKLSQLHIINISLTQKGMEGRLNTELESGLYRITQELINNTLKHAEANTIQLNIEKSNGEIELSYMDDGKGFNPKNNTVGYGIENIQTRVALLKGKIEWDAEENKHTRVNIAIPYYHT
jgi:signal transduction histidine kinase/ligand-binding sensor domain-containing protein